MRIATTTLLVLRTHSCIEWCKSLAHATARADWREQRHHEKKKSISEVPTRAEASSRERWLEGEEPKVPVPEDGPRHLLHLPQGGEEERGLATAHLPHNHGQLACVNEGQQMGDEQGGVRTMSARIDGQVLSALGPSFPPLPGRPKKPSSLEFFLLKQTAFSGSPGPSYTSLHGFLIVHLLVVSPKYQPGSQLRPSAPG